MRPKIIFVVAAALLCAAAIPAQETPAEIVTPFLGLSVPFPDSAPVWQIPFKKNSVIRNHSVTVVFSVDKKGKVKKLDYPSDSVEYITPIEKSLKEMRFNFTDGEKRPFPLKVPVRVNYYGGMNAEKTVRTAFPVYADMTSDSLLLAEFFMLNDVSPPDINNLLPVLYKVDPSKEKAEYMIITARVFLDEHGEVTDVKYPIEGHDRMTHQVQMALLNAEFTPAKVASQARACDFLVTFRVFDNIDYPFSPHSPKDTAKAEPISARYFMTRYFSPADISLPPIPRSHGSGVIDSPLGFQGSGRADVFVRIDEEGIIRATRVISAGPRLWEAADKAVQLIEWYPAQSRSGEARLFSGRVSLHFDQTAYIVYFPEWLEP